MLNINIWYTFSYIPGRKLTVKSIGQVAEFSHYQDNTGQHKLMDVIFICLLLLTMLVMLVVLLVYVFDFNEHETIIGVKMDAGIIKKEEGVRDT